jgi:hypothetical protein
MTADAQAQEKSPGVNLASRTRSGAPSDARPRSSWQRHGAPLAMATCAMELDASRQLAVGVLMWLVASSRKGRSGYTVNGGGPTCSTGLAATSQRGLFARQLIAGYWWHQWPNVGHVSSRSPSWTLNVRMFDCDACVHGNVVYAHVCSVEDDEGAALLDSGRRVHSAYSTTTPMAWLRERLIESSKACPCAACRS